MNSTEGEGGRAFLGWMIGIIAATIAAMVGIPLFGYTVLPAFKRQKLNW